LTSNIVVLFDGDAAGLRAAIRGVDLILEQGMNVKICSFPEGEDPDSFAKLHTQEELQAYLKNEAKDFIEFKTSMLLKEANQDPVRKAATVREIIQSISKIPDPIQQEIYIKQCAAALEVSEPVLFNALAQEQNKKHKPVRKIQNTTNEKQSGIQKIPQQDVMVNPLLFLEKQIISILIQYGDHEASFDELIVSSDAEGNLIEESKTIHTKVHEKVFLDLQQDEVEFIQPEFRSLYDQLIQAYQVEGELKLDKILQQEQPDIGKIISDILLTDEVHQLHDWEKKNIFVKERESVVGQLVSETILTFRRYLIDEKIRSLLEESKTTEEGEDASEFLEDVMQYQHLKKVLSKKLNRVL
jgi:DNA primase